MDFFINGRKWSLIWVNPADDRLRREDGSITLGMTDGAAGTVCVNSKLNEYMTTKVITHELVHCFCFSYSVRLPEETEETVADFLATFGRDCIAVSDDILHRIGIAHRIIV